MRSFFYYRLDVLLELSHTVDETIKPALVNLTTPQTHQ